MCMISECDEVDACGEDLLYIVGCDALVVIGRVFSVCDDGGEAVFLAQGLQVGFEGRATGSADDIAEEEYFHALLIGVFAWFG